MNGTAVRSITPGIFYPLLAILGLLGGVLLWLNTPWGIGVGYDSMFYLNAAENLVDGLGLSRTDGLGNLIPLTHYPPLYPAMLGLLHWVTGWQVDFAARILGAVLLGMNVALIGWLVHRFTRSTLIGGLGALLALSSPVLFDVHLMAMSEPLYLLFVLLLLGLTFTYLQRGDSRTLALAGLLAGSAYLTRYVGVSAVGASGLAVLIMGRKSLRERLNDALLFGLLSAALGIAWYVRNSVLAGGSTNRAFLFHPPTLAHLRQGLVTVSLWLLPNSIPGVVRSLLIAIVVLGLVGAVANLGLRRAELPDDGDQLRRAKVSAGLLALFVLAYLGLLGLSLTFFDASTRLNDRILFPVYTLGMILVLVIIWAATGLQGSRSLQTAAVVGGILLIGVNVVRTQDLLASVREVGLGFNSRAWRTSETIRAVEDLPEDALIYSNEAFPINYLTGRSANWVPEKRDLVKDQPAANYPEQLQEMHRAIEEHNGALVLFDTNLQSGSYPPLEELAGGLQLWQALPDGWIYLAQQ